MANEKRLIDANALVDAVEHIGWYHISLQGTLAKGANSQLHTPLYKADDIYQALKDAPTVDAVEVVHGRWEKCWQEKSKHYFRCSNCHTAYMDGVSGAIAPEYGSRAWNYCPHCGAKMDGGNEDA